MSDTIEHDTAPGGEVPGDDLRDVLGAEWDRQVAAEPANETQAGDRARDERGRFAATGADEAPEQNAAAQPGETEAPEPELPASWADWKDRLAAVPREVRERIAAREAEVAREIEQREAKLRSADPLLAVLQPYRTSLAAMGLSEHEAVQRLLRTQEAFEADPVATLHQLARSRGIDLRTLAQSPSDQNYYQNPQDQFRDPRVDSLLAELQQQKQQEQTRQQQEIAAQIDAFAKDPKHPHFATVRATMGGLLQSGQASDMADAYERAIWAHPEVREKLIAERTKAEAERQRAESAKAAVAAKAKAISLPQRPAPAGGVNGVEADDLRTVLERTWDQLAGTA